MIAKEIMVNGAFIQDSINFLSSIDSQINQDSLSIKPTIIRLNQIFSSIQNDEKHSVLSSKIITDISLELKSFEDKYNPGCLKETCIKILECLKKMEFAGYAENLSTKEVKSLVNSVCKDFPVSYDNRFYQLLIQFFSEVPKCNRNEALDQLKVVIFRYPGHEVAILESIHKSSFKHDERYLDLLVFFSKFTKNPACFECFVSCVCLSDLKIEQKKLTEIKKFVDKYFHSFLMPENLFFFDIHAFFETAKMLSLEKLEFCNSEHFNFPNIVRAQNYLQSSYEPYCFSLPLLNKEQFPIFNRIVLTFPNLSELGLLLFTFLPADLWDDALNCMIEDEDISDIEEVYQVIIEKDPKFQSVILQNFDRSIALVLSNLDHGNANSLSIALYHLKFIVLLKDYSEIFQQSNWRDVIEVLDFIVKFSNVEGLGLKAQRFLTNNNSLNPVLHLSSAIKAVASKRGDVAFFRELNQAFGELDYKNRLIYFSIILPFISCEESTLDEFVQLVKALAYSNKIPEFDLIKSTVIKFIEKTTNHKLNIKDLSGLIEALLFFSADTDINSIIEYADELSTTCLHHNKALVFVLLCDVFSFFPAHSHLNLSEKIQNILQKTNITGVFPTASQLINLCVLNDPEMLQILHDNISLNFTSCGDVLKSLYLHNKVIAYKNDFLIDESVEIYGVLVSASINLSNYNEVKSIDNPYIIYEKHLIFYETSKKFMKTLTQNFPLPIFTNNSIEYVKSLEELRKSRITALPFSIVDQFHANRLPEVDTLRKILDDFERRIKNLPLEKQEELDGLVENSYTAQNISEVLLNFKDRFLFSLLQIDRAKEVPLVNAFFISIVAFINSLPNELNEGEIMSKREESLIAFSSSIQACSAGKAEGVFLAYGLLPAEFKYPLNRENEDFKSLQAAKVESWSKDVLYEHLLDVVSSNSRYMKSILNTPQEETIQQLSHHSIFIKNAIGSGLGIIDKPIFDFYSQTLSKSLLERDFKDRHDLFRSFMEQLDINEIASLLIKSFCSYSKNDLYNAITEFLENELPLENIWDLDEKTSKPVLTLTAAIKILEKIGLITEKTNFLIKHLESTDTLTVKNIITSSIDLTDIALRWAYDNGCLGMYRFLFPDSFLPHQKTEEELRAVYEEELKSAGECLTTKIL